MSEFFERLREAWADLRLGVRVILLLLALGLILILCARPLRAAVRPIALARNSRLAETALLAGDANKARSLGLAAVQAAPDRPDITRTVLKSMDILNDPKRVQVAAILIHHPAATPADKQLALGILARHAPMVMAGAAWAGLTPEEQATPEMIDSFARRLMFEGKPGQATFLLKNLDLANPHDLITRLLLDLLASQGGGDSWQESQKLLIRRIKAATSAGAPVPDWCLAGWNQVPQEHLDPQALEALPTSGPPRLDMLRRRLSQGSRPLDLQDPEVASWLRDVTPADRLPLAILLAGCGRPEAAFEFLEKGPGLTQAEYEWLRSARMRSLDWRPWLNFLQSPAVAEIHQVWIKADLALAHSKLGETEESKIAWNDALQLAATSRQTPRLTDLNHRVRQSMPERAQEAMLAAIRGSGEALPLLNDLHELMISLEKAGRAQDLLDICRAYRGLEPGNPVAITRYAYLALLAGELSPAAAIRLVSPVVQDQPRSPHPRVVAIIATLLLGDRSAASGWIARDQVRWEGAPPFYQWLVARAEMPTGTPPPPEKSQLLPPESAMIEKLR